jgi:dihydroflavonol-4-reductase
MFVTDPKTARVLVTGAAGFVGATVVSQLHKRGYENIYGTVRNSQRDEPELKAICPNIKLFSLDLMDSSIDEWRQVTKQVDFCLHVASPYFGGVPKDPEEELIKPAKEGTRKVLEACFAENVKRVVITSSLAAVIGGRDLWSFAKDNPRHITMSGDVWSNLSATDPANPVTDYQRSKTLAEQLAWEFKDKIDIATVLPGGIYGPVLIKKSCESAEQVKAFVKMGAVPNAGVQAVDVRDVADMHILALEKEAAKGQRFIASGGPITIQNFVHEAKKGATGNENVARPKRIPMWCVKMLAKLGNEKAKMPLRFNYFDHADVDTKNVKDILGMEWRPVINTGRDMAKSMVDNGMLEM